VARPKRLSELTIEELPPFKPRQGRHAGRETEEEEWGAVEWVRWSITQLPVNNQRILTDIFYDELFSMAPDTRALFAEDMDPQKDRLLSALLAAARHMDNPDGVEHHLRAWGVIHRRQLGVTDDHPHDDECDRRRGDEQRGAQENHGRDGGNPEGGHGVVMKVMIWLTL
jgi:hypothetical protein